MDISDAYIDKILVFDMSLYRKNEKKMDFRVFTGFKNNKIVRPLCLLSPGMGGYLTGFGETKYRFFLIKDYLL